MTTCYLLGAGASRGYVSNPSDDDKLPVGEDLFTLGAESDILTKDDFAPLYEELKDYLGVNDDGTKVSPDNLWCDTEQYLQQLQEYSSSHSLAPPPRQPSPDERFNASKRTYEENPNARPHIAAAIAPFYVYELIRCRIPEELPSDNAYAKLVRNVEDDCPVLSLNYDVLLETAALQELHSIQYCGITNAENPPGLVPQSTVLPEIERRGHIHFVKLHGSLNWQNRIGDHIETGVVNPDEKPTEDFHRKALAIHRNAFQIPITTFNVANIPTTSYRELIYDMETQYAPVIMPPAGRGKNYEHMGVYSSVWRAGAIHLRAATELVIIGCSLQGDDYRLRDTLCEHTSENIDITIVDPRADEIESKVEEIFTDPNIKPSYDSEDAFVDYVNDMS